MSNIALVQKCQMDYVSSCHPSSPQFIPMFESEALERLKEIYSTYGTINNINNNNRNNYNNNNNNNNNSNDLMVFHRVALLNHSAKNTKNEFD